MALNFGTTTSVETLLIGQVADLVSRLLTAGAADVAGLRREAKELQGALHAQMHDFAEANGPSVANPVNRAEYLLSLCMDHATLLRAVRAREAQHDLADALGFAVALSEHLGYPSIEAFLAAPTDDDLRAGVGRPELEPLWRRALRERGSLQGYRRAS